MNLQALKNIIIVKRLKPSDVAKYGHVSRAAVCKWFKSRDEWVNVETRTLINLSAGLKISPEFFLKKQKDLSPLTARFLWDHIYPTMEHFALALARGGLPAIARLVQVLGFHGATEVIGKKAVLLFPKYKKFIKPVRRKELEVLWELYLNQL